MKNLLFSLLLLLLSGCALDGNIHSLDQYFSNNNIIQEQKNSSKKAVNINTADNSELSAWALENYPLDCDWFDLERTVDGDTIIVDDRVDRIRVRMIGIDTPESKKEGTAIEDFALEASDQLSDWLKDENRVCLIFDETGDQYDTYGRRLSYVFTDDGKDLNADMIKMGWAEAYTRFPLERKEEFLRLEATAKEARLGQWQ